MNLLTCNLTFIYISILMQIQSTINQSTNAEYANKPKLYWEQIKDQCVRIGQGYFNIAYLYKPLNLVIKRLKNFSWASFSKPKFAMRQIKSLDKIAPIFPNLCEYQLIEDNTLSGLSVKYYEGKKWDELINDGKSIFRKSPVARIRLIIKLGQIVKQIQGINICHGDISVDNVIIRVYEDSSQMDPHLQIYLIDFGSGFEFQKGKPVTIKFTGWQFLIPPETAINKEIDYEASGVNAYQLGRVALHILLLKNFKDYNSMIVSTSDQELSILKSSEEFPIQLVNQLQTLISNDIQARTKALVELNLTKLEEKTRQILQKKIDKQISEQK